MTNYVVTVVADHGLWTAVPSRVIEFDRRRLPTLSLSLVINFCSELGRIIGSVLSEITILTLENIPSEKYEAWCSCDKYLSYVENTRRIVGLYWRRYQSQRGGTACIWRNHEDAWHV